MLVHHRLKDKTGMAGMADGDNRYYGYQNKFVQEKLTDTTVDINAQFFSFYFMPIQLLLKSL